jgi:hypothetical protein
MCMGRLCGVGGASTWTSAAYVRIGPELSDLTSAASARGAAAAAADIGYDIGLCQGVWTQLHRPLLSSSCVIPRPFLPRVLAAQFVSFCCQLYECVYFSPISSISRQVGERVAAAVDRANKLREQGGGQCRPSSQTACTHRGAVRPCSPLSDGRRFA